MTCSHVDADEQATFHLGIPFGCSTSAGYADLNHTMGSSAMDSIIRVRNCNVPIAMLDAETEA